MNNWTQPSSLDRLAGARDAREVEQAWQDAVVVEVDPAGNLAARGGRPRALRSPGPRQESDIFLGRSKGRAWFARLVPRIDGESMGWRDADPIDIDPLADAVALGRWHAQRPLCERCGAPTVPDLAGARRVCPECGQLAFARTDPCVIVAITDPADRLLLARQAQWERGRVSIIAGFIEAGESAEQACHREVGEEVGVRLAELSYVSSQPWPMPRSLMLGFTARAVDSHLIVDGDEIVEGAYYTRDELAAAVATSELVLPSGASIARYLIERWLSGS